MRQKRETKQSKQQKNSSDAEAALQQQLSKRLQQQQQQLHQQQQQQLLGASNGQVNEKNCKSILLAQGEEGDHHHHLVDVTASKGQEEKKAKMNYCFKGKWILLFSMTVTLLITAVLVAMLTVSLLDNEDQCFNLNYQFQQPNYNLFSTKTTYTTTIQYLNHSSSAASNSRNIYNDKNSIELPNIFSKSDSLKSLHNKLTSSASSCKIRQLHYFGRHAARFPNAKGINEINKLLTNVQARIDLSKFTTPLNTNTNNGNNNESNNNNNNNNGNKSNVCFNPLAQYKQWTTYMVAEQGNLIMDTGADETLAIAQRLKEIYPEMFNASEAKIEFGTTNELRTAQTAIVFLKQIDNFPLDFCRIDQFPTENLSSASKAEELENNGCYKTFLRKFNKEKLEFHKRCETYHREEFPIPYNLNLKKSNRTEFIATSLSKKLKLTKEDYLSTEETDAIYKICKYETALAGSSIWCNLFSDNDLKFFEFLNDIDDFFNQAYGHPDQARSACPVTTELIRSFKLAKAQQDPSTRSHPEAHFYFTHSEVIQKILAASVDLEQDPEYSPKNVLMHLQAGTTPEARIWRTSLFTPFSANLAFTLYECPLKATTIGSPIDVDVSESNLKVVASLNEQPILLDGCANHVCDLNEILTDSRINKEKRCKLEEICKKNIVVN